MFLSIVSAVHLLKAICLNDELLITIILTASYCRDIFFIPKNLQISQLLDFSSKKFLTGSLKKKFKIKFLKNIEQLF